MTCLLVGVVAILKADLQASWFNFSFIGRRYVLMLRADFEVTVKASVIVFYTLY